MFPLFWKSKHHLVRVSKIEKKIDDIIHFSNIWVGGSDIKKCFADNNDDSRKNEMLYNVKLEV